MLNVSIKKLHKDAIIPRYSRSGDAGLDLTAVSKEYDNEGNVCYDTGLSFAIPEGYVGLIFPRSSNAKKDLTLTNSVGVIDSNYRGSVSFKFKKIPKLQRGVYNEAFLSSSKEKEYDVGDRVGQMIILPYPQINFIEVDELDETERGDKGFGSSGA